MQPLLLLLLYEYGGRGVVATCMISSETLPGPSSFFSARVFRRFDVSFHRG